MLKLTSTQLGKMATVFFLLSKMSRDQQARRKYLANYHRLKMRQWMKEGGPV